MMMFPDTVEEFMEQYKIVDTEGIYMSKGSELVPIFRMKQWFEHLPSAQPKQRWIPCVEMLPEKGKVVLITNEKGNVRCGQYRGLWSANGNATKWTFRGNVIETVVAWMPLPKPYESQESEDKE